MECGSEIRIGCLLATHFAMQAELRRRPELRGQPALLSDGVGQRPLVVDANPEVGRGLAGLPIAEALSRCGDAVVLERDQRYLSEVAAGLRAALRRVAPAVELAGPGRFYLDVAGLDGLYGCWAGAAETLLGAMGPEWQPRLGLAGGKFAAWRAAAQAEAGWWRLGDAGVVAATPLSWLIGTPAAQRAAHFGIRTWGDAAALPPGAAADYLGRAAQGLRFGAAELRMSPAVLSERLCAAMEFPYAVASADGVLAGLTALGARLWAGGASGRQAGLVHLVGTLEVGLESWRGRCAIRCGRRTF